MSDKKHWLIEVKQTNHFEVVIEAATQEEAADIFSDYITDDFGDPVNSMLEYGEFEEVFEVVIPT
jgi:hypothetical protein